MQFSFSYSPHNLISPLTNSFLILLNFYKSSLIRVDCAWILDGVMHCKCRHYHEVHNNMLICHVFPRYNMYIGTYILISCIIATSVWISAPIFSSSWVWSQCLPWIVAASMRWWLTERQGKTLAWTSIGSCLAHSLFIVQDISFFLWESGGKISQKNTPLFK